jgi:Zn-dependent protease
LPPIEEILIQFAILVVSLSFHEAAHAWAADKLGDPTARMLGRLTINPMAHIDWIGTVLFPLIAMMSGIPLLGWAKPVPVDTGNLAHPRRDFAIIAAAGPASNLLLATIAALIYRAMVPGAGEMASSMVLASETVRFFLIINVMLAVFNMIPVPPLDGGNVLMGLVPERTATAINWLRPYGIFILYGLMFTGLLFQVMMPITRAFLSVLL